LHVTRALPARRLLLAGAGEDSSVEVELDPASVPEIVDTLHTAGLKVVGWYHSHPVFFTHPSIRDIENQANYQSLFKRGDENDAGGAGGGERPRGESKREEGENEGSAGVREEGGGSGGEEGGLGSNAGGVGGRAQGRSQSTAAPFVACIVGPYDLRNVGPVSDVRWFHVVGEDEDGDGGGLAGVGGARAAAERAARGEPVGRPFELACVSAGCTTVSPDLLLDLRRLADCFAGGGGVGGDGAGAGAREGEGETSEGADRVNLKEQWRDGMTRLEKLEESLVARLPATWPQHLRKSYVGGVLRYLTEAWGIEGARAREETGGHVFGLD